MRYLRFDRVVVFVGLFAVLACVNLLGQSQPQTATNTQQQTQAQAREAAQPPARPNPSAASITDIGSVPTQEDMGNLAWVTGPSGKGLPPGSGTAKKGLATYLAKCSMCHGQDARGVQWQPGAFSPLGGPPLSGAPKGNGEQPHNPWIPPLTNGAPFPEVIFNTIAVEMPMFRPGTLTADEVYSLTAFLFFKNGFIKEDDVVNSETLPKIQMPNRGYFPASDDVYMDMKKRGCIQTYGVCVGN